MNVPTWISEPLKEWHFVSDEAEDEHIRQAITTDLTEAYAAHLATLDTDKLAERIAEAVYPTYPGKSVKQAIAAHLAPLLEQRAKDEVEIARLKAENTELLELLRECRPWVDRQHSTHHEHCGCALLERIDAVLEKEKHDD